MSDDFSYFKCALSVIRGKEKAAIMKWNREDEMTFITAEIFKQITTPPD